ncbi:MAG: hypothetical protein SNJ74_12910, partial [Fimbriimonadaceae bacterium]
SLEPEARVVETSARSENVVPWLRDLLTVYPGSQHGNIETRGLDSSFAESTYVPTALEDALYDDLRSRKVRLLILCGNAGDGKTALLQHLAQRFGVDRVVSGNRIWESRTDDGLLLKANLDGAASWNGRSANELLDEFFEPFLGGVPSDDRAHLLAINDGRLLEWLRLKEEQIGKKPLIAALLNGLANDDDPRSMPDHVRFISLNHRSLVGGIDENSGDIHSEFLDQLLRKMLGGEQREGHWAPCQTCSAYERCPVGPTATSLLASFRETDADDEKAKRGRRLRERLGEALQAVHQRGELHITTRELRGALSYVLFGTAPCEEIHENPSGEFRPYFDRAFDPDSGQRQGELLRELTRLDPALESHPLLDRWLIGRSSREIVGAGPAYPTLSVASARRRAFFEWLPDEIEAVAGDAFQLGLAGGRHLGLFREASAAKSGDNDEICRRVCLGISMLEGLPESALNRDGMVPLRLPGRNPTETIFWIEKRLERFRLEPELPPVSGRGLPRLPNRLRLVYRFEDGREESLSMGYGLFYTLISLSEGEQLTERRTDDLFANLRIFVQRLSMEDDSVWFAWHPRGGEKVYRLAVRHEGGTQKVVCESGQGGG